MIGWFKLIAHFQATLTHDQIEKEEFLNQLEIGRKFSDCSGISHWIVGALATESLELLAVVGQSEWTFVFRHLIDSLAFGRSGWTDAWQYFYTTKEYAASKERGSSTGQHVSLLASLTHFYAPTKLPHTYLQKKGRKGAVILQFFF